MCMWLWHGIHVNERWLVWVKVPLWMWDLISGADIPATQVETVGSVCGSGRAFT